MPLDSSILNIGEYYSSHYLDTTFAGDLREQVRAWREAGSAAPPRKLAALGPGYFRAKAEALEIAAPGERWHAGRELAGTPGCWTRWATPTASRWTCRSRAARARCRSWPASTGTTGPG